MEADAFTGLCGSSRERRPRAETCCQSHWQDVSVLKDRRGSRQRDHLSVRNSTRRSLAAGVHPCMGKARTSLESLLNELACTRAECGRLIAENERLVRRMIGPPVHRPAARTGTDPCGHRREVRMFTSGYPPNRPRAALAKMRAKLVEIAALAGEPVPLARSDRTGFARRSRTKDLPQPSFSASCAQGSITVGSPHNLLAMYNL